MSPQQRMTCLGFLDTYSAFKADVFSLGMTLYALTSLTSLSEPQNIASFPPKVGALLCTENLKCLLLLMTSEQEKDRPTMQEVLMYANIENAKYDLAKAVQMRETGDYQRTLELLELPKTVLKEDTDTDKVCLELGLVYSHFGKWAEVEAIQAQGLSVHSNCTLQLNNILAETYFQRGQYKDCISVCERTLASGKGPTFELQKALYYLADSHYWLEDGLGIEQVDKWAEVLVSDSPHTQCLTLLIIADKQAIEGNADAVRGYEAGLELAGQYLPHCLFTACSRNHLGELYDDALKPEIAEQHYSQAKHLCQTHFPLSHTFANCLYNLGVLYDDTRRTKEAEELYLQAKNLCETHFPLSHTLARCLNNLGLLYENTHRTIEAEELYLQATDLCKAQFPHSIELASCLNNLGLLYANSPVPQKAEPLYLQSEQLCLTYFPQSQTLINCLYNLGALYHGTYRLQQAEQLYLRAEHLCNAYFPQSIQLANCLHSLGLLHESQGRSVDASEKVREAEQVYACIGLQEKVAECQELLETLSLD